MNVGGAWLRPTLSGYFVDSSLVDVSETLELVEDFLVGLGFFNLGQFLFEHMLNKLLRGGVAGHLGAPLDAVPEVFLQFDGWLKNG